MSQTDKISRLGIAAGVVLLFNAGAAILTAGLIAHAAASCTGTCLAKVGFIVAWGGVGIVSGIYLFRRHNWALWGGCLFFLFQSISVQTSDFFYNLNVGLSLYIALNIDNFTISLNLLAWVAIALLISEYVLRNDTNEGLKTEPESSH